MPVIMCDNTKTKQSITTSEFVERYSESLGSKIRLLNDMACFYLENVISTPEAIKQIAVSMIVSGNVPFTQASFGAIMVEAKLMGFIKEG